MTVPFALVAKGETQATENSSFDLYSRIVIIRIGGILPLLEESRGGGHAAAVPHPAHPVQVLQPLLHDEQRIVAIIRESDLIVQRRCQVKNVFLEHARINGKG